VLVARFASTAAHGARAGEAQQYVTASESHCHDHTGSHNNFEAMMPCVPPWRYYACRCFLPCRFPFKFSPNMDDYLRVRGKDWDTVDPCCTEDFPHEHLQLNAAYNFPAKLPLKYIANNSKSAEMTAMLVFHTSERLLCRLANV
jgi:hypothetical protein